MNHRIGGMVFALLVGGGLAWLVYDRVTDPGPRLERERQEAIVLQAREALKNRIAPQSDLEIVDPLEPNRRAGKVYIYPVAGGWEVSGYYRRDQADGWHPWLMRLDEAGSLEKLAVRDSDPAVVARAASDARFDVEQ